MDHIDVIQEILTVAGRLKKVPEAIHKNAKLAAEAEFKYRKALAQEMLKLRAEGFPGAMISDLARGSEQVAELKYERDLAKGLWTSSIESKKALENELSGLQSVLRVQNEVGG